jgi:hypothetical protein
MNSRICGSVSGLADEFVWEGVVMGLPLNMGFIA